MKKTYLFFFLITITFSFAQKQQENLNEIVNSEMKSAYKLLNVAVNANTLNYDVTYHQLEFTVDPSVYAINGKVTTTFTALSNMNTITFDMANELTVSSVKMNAMNLTFAESGNNELVITLPATQLAGTSGTVEITYSGTPPLNGFNAFTTQVRPNGSNTLYTLSEPFGARDWWPCKQDLNDKVNSIDVYITAPSQYIAVSNGVEPEAPVVNGANKTTHFHHGYPIPAYLICMAVTDYSVYNQSAGTAPNTYPIVNYIYPEDFDATLQTQLDQTPLILDLYSNLFEIYPFHNEKYGHAQFGWGGGMEHTTVSFMVGFERQLIAHEMAHQWFGDKITCGTWKDIWLNEGFATYVASMVIENFDGSAAFVTDKTNMINSITSQTGGAVYLTDTEATNVNRIFSSRLSYNKGAMVLNMLRLKLGDTNFFQGIRNYLADSNLAYKYATTTDFKTKMEAVYGSSLTEFFNDWIYKQGYPTYAITAQNWGAGQVKITVNQSQSNASVTFFEMPLPIRITGTGGQVYDTIIDNTTNNQQFIISVPFSMTGFQFDPKKDIITKNNSVTLTNDSFELEKAIAVYPNPVIDELHIQMPSDISIEKITVFNNLGQKVIENKALDFSISNLSSGVLFVQIETSKGIFHKKIIKN
ncbi:M1 family aminopeptidase [Flavobacterium sp. SUN052]|uniref:M1 family aminopeptidase n=1 Tax=Flavobacterium sp. SUN052 TaxID=3002441 RepID=UPI00237D4BFD|nr:M1 family aminopeptidase [Flavobacterium sp. SUN052]MEC4003359.1 M1 family aminopeptidase [Flavobacterium sp. SUN052]